MIRYYTVSENKIKKIDEIEDSEGILWIHLTNPDQENIDYIVNRYQIPKDYINSALDEDEVARTEHIRTKLKHKLLTFTYPKKIEKDKFITRLLSITLLENIIITTSLDQPSIIEPITENKFTYIKNLDTTMDLVIEMIWLITHEFLAYIHEIKQMQESIGSNLLRSTDSNTLIKQSNLIKSTIYFDYGLRGNKRVLEIIRKQVSEDIPVKFEAIKDIDIENEQALVRNKQQQEIIESIGDINSSIISNNLNIVAKIMTSLTILMTIPTIISGIWGMNVELPFLNHEYSFGIIMAITFILMFICYRALKRHDFL